MKDHRYGFLTTYPRLAPFAKGVVPLSGDPVQAFDGAVELSGRILFAWRRDICVAIESPVSGFHKGLHIPHFDPRPTSAFVSWRGGPGYELTEKGRNTARNLLVELYREKRSSRGGPS
jgi:hypothetical protein